MKVLLDTNVLSEVRRPAPEPKVLAWLDTIDEDRAFISVASIAELRRGIALMDDGRRREALAAWLAVDLPGRFSGRILPIDPAIAERWGDVMAQARQSGFALSVMDGFFAATALVGELVLATRNTKDFAPLGVSLLNPWTDEGAPE
ncbi:MULTISPECIES: type II toxin-antitoxin system VapC family toxin [unclassified Bradyrhizobium]|uniref:type II toxin-antitoxin system VapC family toxin n=1 Tax=unclassified Bradyrhizobium TaxID=2631580 RepID=UPI001BA505FE|nr:MULTISPECIES: type II toxin-antitoxin system VapC family toxin [unclassified Bradyrhizobium]MBR1208184.1 type II toxin-antitoxin system VapC family toxin [Bradyrhizobium sp. AUGA SZCCT0124]MBR1316407.1 type II toxin-antitoxin system VapC family toxin [Bradyrhizobium sp. AUGA SZCCT0051]MBR1344698.1 type II toxin-antitoxin system VapC family toxin [Bradyrhizobium sp. AUGA SZCCT0105]MBR1359428.1 type II toxin-antitoxin system VapC family toxin [Bradyrhizobium sp. AUGA SZCCT0045]